MAGKRQLWKEFWRDATEMIREFHNSTQPTFKKVFKQRGMIKRYTELLDIESSITTAILGGCRINGERAAYPVDGLVNGKIDTVWKLTETLTVSELKQVRKSYRRGSRDLAAQHNRVTKRIEKQTGQRLDQLDLGFFDEGQQELP
jgi:hypothetical protein